MGERLTAVRLLEMLAAALVVVMMSNALIGPVLDPTQTGGDTNPILRLMWLPAYGLIAALAALRAPHLMRFWLPAGLMLILLAWVFASVSWSILPDISQRRAVAVTVTTLFGLYLASAYSGRALAELLAATFLFLALGSYFVCLAVPSIGVHSDINAGLWRGLWYEKNQMGAMMVYGALAATAAAVLSPPRRGLWLLTLGLCIGLVVMTHSATSALALAIVLGGSAVLTFMRRGPVGAIVVVWCGVTAAMMLGGLAVLAPELIYAALGKDPSLTGRTLIWQLVERAADRSPMLGYGFAAFWDIRSSQANWIREQLQWVVPTAHNGWLDLRIQLGAVGVALFASLFATAALAAAARRERLADAYFSVLFLAVYGLTIMSESFILAHNSLPWVLATACMARALGPRPRVQSVRDAPVPMPEDPAPVTAPLVWDPPPLAPVFGRRTAAPA